MSAESISTVACLVWSILDYLTSESIGGASA